MRLKQKGIAIVGSGRSGTSFLIKMLHANGITIGNCTGGTLENLDVRVINDSYLAENFQAIKNSGKPYGILPSNEISINPETQRKSKQAIDNLKSISSNYWAFKDPRTTLLHDMWVKHVDIVVGVFRNPYEVADSYMKLLDVYYNKSTKEKGYQIMLDYWLRFNQSMIHIFETTDKPKFMLEFNNNINEQVNNLFEDLELIKYNSSMDFKERLKHENQPTLILTPTLLKTWNQLQKWRIK